MAQGSREWTSGSHRAWLEAPDVLWVVFDGETDLSTARWVLSVFREAAEPGPFYFALDVSRSMPGAEAREYLVDHMNVAWFRGVVYVGAGLPQRAMTRGFLLALYVGGKDIYDVEFVDSARQARAWIERHRVRRTHRVI